MPTSLLRPPQRVLIVRMSHLGDIAQTIPLVHGLRAKWPSIRLAWAVQPEFQGLIEPLVDEVIPFRRRGGARAWPAIRRAMGRFGADLAIDAQGNWKSAAAARLSGAPLRVGFARQRWQEPLAARVFGIRAPEGTGEVGLHSPHLVDRILGLSKALTGDTKGRLDAAVTEVERNEARKILRAAQGATPCSGPPSGPSSVPDARIEFVLHPGAPGDARSWPRAHYRDLGLRLLEAGHKILVLTGPAEADVGEWMKSEVQGAAHIAGQRGLRLLAALFDVLCESGARLITGDSGPAHVAASAGLPVVLIAGPEDPARTGPWPVPPPFAASTSPTSPHRVAGIAHGIESMIWTPRQITDTTVDCVMKALALR